MKNRFYYYLMNKRPLSVRRYHKPYLTPRQIAQNEREQQLTIYLILLNIALISLLAYLIRISA